MELEIHLLMCCSHDGLGPCINLNFEPVQGDGRNANELLAHRHNVRLPSSGLQQILPPHLLPAQFHLRLGAQGKEPGHVCHRNAESP